MRDHIMFYIAETNANESVNNASLWKPVDAKDLSAAKRAASNARMFQRTAAWVGRQKADGSFYAVAVKRCDAISGKSKPWTDL